MCVCDVVVYSIQVYSKLYSLHQIVVSYVQVTSLHYVNIVFFIFLFLFIFFIFIATDQSVSYYTLHGSVAFVFFVQSEALLPVQLQK